MSISPLSWSEERQQSLNAHLQGLFASDAWRVGPTHKPEKQSTLSPVQRRYTKNPARVAARGLLLPRDYQIC